MTWDDFVDLFWAQGKIGAPIDISKRLWPHIEAALKDASKKVRQVIDGKEFVGEFYSDEAIEEMKRNSWNAAVEECENLITHLRNALWNDNLTAHGVLSRTTDEIRKLKKE